LAEAPWDTTPASQAQQDYARALVQRLHEEADWSQLDAMQMSLALGKLRDVQRPLGMKFREIDGMDTGRGVR
jgi:hypothetical protein